MPPNHLLNYLFQCRSKEFIECYNTNIEKPCTCGLFSLYNGCYALDIVLNANIWRKDLLPIVEQCKKNCQELKDFLSAQVEIPNHYEKTFCDFLRKNFQYYTDEEDFDWILDGDIEKLKSQGYREIDCYLYEASMKLHYEEMMNLLAKGGNPYVFISADYPSTEEEELRFEGWSLYEEARMRVADLIVCDSYDSILERRFHKIDKEISHSEIHCIFRAAAYQIVLNKIDDFEKNKV